MYKKLEDTIVLNGPMLIRVDHNEIIINVYQNETRMKFEPIDKPFPIEGILVHRKGSFKGAITSDIYDVFEKPFKMKDFSVESAKELIIELIQKSIQFIARISKEEDNPVLIQNSYNEKNKYLYSTIGLVDDVRIIFAEIKEVKKKELEKRDAYA